MKTTRRTHWLRTTVLVLAACMIVGLVLSAALYFGSAGSSYASATLQFTFDGAAAGVAPNGAAFDLRDILRDEVLEAGLKAAGLDGAYTPAQLRPHLVARGVYPEDMPEQVMHYESLLNFTSSREQTIGDYHPTTFEIALYDSFDSAIGRAKLTALLDGILEAYRAYFTRVYAYGLDTGTLFTLDSYDYPQQLQILEQQLASLSAYAQELYEKAPSFRLGGAGFNDISVRLNTLIESNIARLNADLTINALSRDVDRLMTQYQFEIRDLSIQKEKQNQELDRLDKLIESYEKNEIIYLSTADSLTKIDGNSSETYDALVNRRKTVADGITTINYRISTYELMLSDLLRNNGLLAEETEAPAEDADPAETGEAAGEPAETAAEALTGLTAEELAERTRRSDAARAVLEENIGSLIAKRDAILSDFAAMLDAYNGEKISDLTVTVTTRGYEAPSILSGAFAMTAVRTAGPLCALGFMVCMALIARSRRRETLPVPAAQAEPAGDAQPEADGAQAL